MAKKQIPSTYRVAGRKKGGRPVIEQYKIDTTGGSNRWSAIKIFFLILLAVGLGYLLYYLHINSIVVWFNRNLISEKTIFSIDLYKAENEYLHYLYNLLNVLLIGVWLSAISPVSGKRSFYISIALIIALYVISILNFGYVGLYLWLNFDFLNEKVYISNDIQGIKFFLSNIAFFLLVYAISFLIEAEVD